MWIHFILIDTLNHLYIALSTHCFQDYKMIQIKSNICFHRHDLSSVSSINVIIFEIIGHFYLHLYRFRYNKECRCHRHVNDNMSLTTTISSLTIRSRYRQMENHAILCNMFFWASFFCIVDVIIGIVLVNGIAL